MNQDYFIKNTFSKFIEIKGKDSATFLQGLITNDIYKCYSNENLIYSCFLSPQGKFLADFFILKKENYYLIEIHKKYFELFFNKIKMYKLRSDVELKENNKLISIILFNEETLLFNQQTILYEDPRNNHLGKKIYLNKESDDLKMILGLKEFNYETYKKVLMKNLIPHAPDDLIQNKSLLLENNYQNINAIDWEKGCYIGQEITARMKYRSLLKKKLYVLEIISGDINSGEDIIQEDINFGNVISKIDKYILCMLKINLVENKHINQEKIKINEITQIKFL